MQYATPEINIEKYLKDNILFLIEKQIIKSYKAKKVVNKNKSKDIQNKLNKLADLYLNDLIEKDKYTFEYNKLHDEMAKIKEEEHTLQKEVNTKKLQHFLDGDFLKVYDDLSDIEKQRFWRNIIDKIIIYGKDQIDVKFI